jgi:hypothetical protein
MFSSREIQRQDDDPIMLRAFQGSRRIPLPTCLQTVAQLPASAFAWPAGQVIEHHKLVPDGHPSADAMRLERLRQLRETLANGSQASAVAYGPAP